MASSREIERKKQEVEVLQIEVVAFCHATEDCSRVEESIKNVFPQEFRGSIRVNYVEEKGYYGNPINILIAKIVSRSQVDLTMRYLATVLEPLEKTILTSTFDLRYDPKTGRFVVRFSKQDLLFGQFRITDSDDVVKVTLYLKNAKKRSNVLNFFKSVGLLAK